MQGRNAAEWAKAMEEELDQLGKNNTWEFIHKSDIQIGHWRPSERWVYKIIQDVNGNIAQFKAKWMVKTHLQQFGVDFDKTFATVVKLMAFRILFAISAFFDRDIDQIDVTTTFFYALIDQLVYVSIPKEIESVSNRDMICKLLKVLYSLKQSFRPWYERPSRFLLERLKSRRINADYNIFVISASLDRPVIRTFVNDIKIMALKRSGMIERVRS